MAFLSHSKLIKIEKEIIYISGHKPKSPKTKVSSISNNEIISIAFINFTIKQEIGTYIPIIT